MTDKYRLTDTPHATGEGDALPPEKDPLTGLLWVALALCAGLNTMMSIVSPDNLLPSIALGVATLGCIGLLVVRYLGRRHS